MSNLVTHMRTSAEAGNADAQFNLGVLLDNGFDDKGRFVGAKREEAISWLRKAAKNGLSRAQCKLAQIYAAGENPADLERAGSWFMVAMDNASGGGGISARDGFEKVARRLSSEQLSRVQACAVAWTTRIEAARDLRERALSALAVTSRGGAFAINRL